ncbi:hypothetical protein K525DRAFT_163206, partial [Schizophyllum commune Loenen D]
FAQRTQAKRYQPMLMWPQENVCGWCYVYHVLRMLVFEPRGMLHDVADCPHIEGRDEFYDLRAKIRYGPGPPICFSCHIPSLDRTIHSEINPGEMSHPFRRYVLPMAWAVYHAPELRQRAMATLSVGVANGHDWNDVDGFARWMSDRSATDHPTSGLAILAFFYDRYV